MVAFNASKLNLPFMKYRMYAILISLVFVAFSIGLVAFKGLNLSVDFTGGLVLQVEFSSPAEVAEIRSSLSSIGQGQAIIQAYNKNEILIRFQAQDEEVRREVLEKLKNDFGDLKVLKIDKVGPVVGKELRAQAIIALSLALAGILTYMAFRFKFRFGIAAVAALVHDTLIMLGIYSLTGKEVSVAFIAAILTVVGYSLNDSIVVLDRIRENWASARTKGIIELVDLSINQTLARTINTSLTTLLPVIAMYIFGGEVIGNFAFAFLVGILVGTYSSIYIASSIVAEWYLRSPKF
ncbi:MAG TPA: protein translocase subunit SecF [Synergistaceae bacterium]|jgi:preprotein translocase subunit SecF|nr:protein translocase subunit SecF [Synergistaceae bacterium]